MDTEALAIGQEIELSIDGYSSEGEGVGRAARAVCFVSGALAGERVRARLTEKKKNLFRADLAAVIHPSTARRTPPCPLFAVCGGCQVQHMDYEEQLTFKEKRVRDAFERIGRIDGALVRPVRAMSDPWRYRNKATFTVGAVGGKPILGFLKRASREIVPVPDCVLTTQSTAAIALEALELCLSAGGRPERIVIRSSLSSGEKMTVIETRGRALHRGETIAENIIAARPEVTGVVNAVLSPADSEPPRYRTLRGRGTITEELSSLTFEISAGSFFQVNSLQADALYRLAADSIGQEDRVLDAYSGIGGFALFAARRAQEVIGVEQNEAAVRNARQNTARNGLTNVRFLRGDLEKDSGRQAGDWRGFTVLIADPPRRGLSARFIEQCSRIGLRTVLYCSCDPATLARDCRLFAGIGFLVREITPFDMFPQTSQIECLAKLERG